METDLSEAIQTWKIQMGEENVLIDEATLSRYGRCTIPYDERQIIAVLRPGSTEDIQAILQTANRHRIPLYPVSKGKNWGYGSTCPVTDQNAILDLGRMNRILEVNDGLGYAVVEPGVTLRQLCGHLQKCHPFLQMDGTGAHPDSSLVANVLERGYGLSHYSDHFLYSSSMEVILADGRIIKTGFGHYHGSKTHHLYKWGLGPFLDGIFTQSNFGIVTKLTIWLQRKPAYSGLLMMKISSDEKLGSAIERLRELKLQGLIPPALHLYNDIRALSSAHQFPRKAVHGIRPMPKAFLRKWAKKEWFDAWNGISGLQGNRRIVKTHVREIRKSLRGIARIQFFPEWFIRLAAIFQGIYKLMTGYDLAGKLATLDIFRGIPSELPTLLPYWRHRKPAPKKDLDPARDRCGLVWCTPLIPNTKEDSLAIIRISRPVLEEYGFDFNISLNIISERAIDCIIGILYDKEDPGDTQKAKECYEKLLSTCLKEGYIPYRLGIGSMNEVIQKDAFWGVCRDIKNALDPNHIIAPGRYHSQP